MIERLMVVYVSSLDHRRINQNHTPYLYSLLEKYPWTRINNIPEADLIPTLMTGLYTHEHGIWQVRLKSDWDVNSSSNLDYLPDIVTTTSQCFMHLFTGSYDLAAVPYWRRRRFEIFKTRYMKRELKGFLKMNGFDTFFNIIGESNCNYIYNTKLHKLDQIKPELFYKDLRFELVEDYGLDRLEHWFLDNQEKMIDSYNKIDIYIKFLHSECEKKGITLMILADHGQEVVKSSVDIIQKIHEMGIKNNEITYFIEAVKARFWFHSDSAREKMLNYLSENHDGVLLSREDMYEFNVKFEDDSYGEYYFVLNPGTIFFPNDYYHPIGNIFLALTDDQQRSRIQSPIYRGYHGYLPYNECEKGFLMLLDNDYKTNGKEIEIIDVAPTVLRLMGYNQPESLKGVNAFHE
ncbi:MAG: alkaline phosphatase family protein [Candidatus Dadabacteria bacterium]|nr:alkaline phosphatase family protein [Candidatus Dadabacteria bacterium]